MIGQVQAGEVDLRVPGGEQPVIDLELRAELAEASTPPDARAWQGDPETRGWSLVGRGGLGAEPTEKRTEDGERRRRDSRNPRGLPSVSGRT